MNAEQGRAPNMRDVARAAGVSYQTVSRVLNDSPSIRSTTRERVLAAIAELGYRPNQAARALVTSRTRTIGLLASQSSQYGPSTAITAIEVAAREAGYRVSMTTTSSADYAALRSALDYLLGQSVDALVVIAPQGRVFEAIRELAPRIPFVILESTGRDVGHSVAVDQAAGARLAIGHLTDLGHTEIAHLAGPQDWIDAASRLRGYRDALAEAGLRAHEPVLGDWSSRSGHAAGIELLRRREFTALFAANDQLALGFLHACRERGVDVPGDVSVIGFDDIPDAAYLAPPLTTIRQDFAELGRRAIAILLAELHGDPPPVGRLLAPELIVRASTASP